MPCDRRRDAAGVQPPSAPRRMIPWHRALLVAFATLLLALTASPALAATAFVQDAAAFTAGSSAPTAVLRPTLALRAASRSTSGSARASPT